MLSFPRVSSSTPVFYFKLTAGIREKGSELGKVIVTEREGDSFKSWGQECSSASQGRRYFMAFTFLHDKLMPRIDRVVLEEKKTLTIMPLSSTLHISSLFLAHLHFTLLRLCGKPQGHTVWSFSLLAEAGESKGLKCRVLFSISSFTHLCFIKSSSISCWFTEASFLWDLFRETDSRGSLHSHWTPRLTPRSYTIPHCLPSPPHKLFFIMSTHSINTEIKDCWIIQTWILPSDGLSLSPDRNFLNLCLLGWSSHVEIIWTIRTVCAATV